MASSFTKYGKVFIGGVLGIAVFSALTVLDKGAAGNNIKLPDADIVKLQPAMSEPLLASDPFGSMEKPKLPTMVPPVPKLPSMPVLSGNQDMKKGSGVKVVGVINGEMALVATGSKTCLVRPGEHSEAGNIGAITASGVYINGVFHSLAASSSNKEKIK